MYPLPSSGPSTPVRLYQPTSTPYQPQASISQQPYSSPHIPSPHHLTPDQTPGAYYPAYQPRMDAPYPSHGASPQTDYTPSTPQIKHPYSQPGSVGSKAPVRTNMSPGMLPVAPAPFDGPAAATAAPTPTMAHTTVLPPSTPVTAPALISNPYISEHRIVIHDKTTMQGSPGAEFTVNCDLSFPESAPSSPSFSADNHRRNRAIRIVFGSHPLPTTVTQLHDPSGAQLVHLKAQVPGWTLVATSATGNRVPVSVQVLMNGQDVVGSVALGEYSYLSFTSGSRVPTYGGGYSSSAAPNPLKRSGEALEAHHPSPSAFAHRRIISNGMGHDSPKMDRDVPLPGTTYSTPTMQPATYASPLPGTWTGDGMAGLTVADQGFPTPGQPNLARASQLPSAIPVPSFPSTGTAKASLELVGDLNNMAKGWSTDEWTNRRRLVQFWRKQEGTQITAAFQSISQEKWSAHTQSIIVSCIFRDDNNTCYVTSVDAIYLLEALVGNRFTVEEKNRIRRNLEGFRPLTVSKSKPGSEDFFKVIMGFPNPKPRNIEKDVKVFPWAIMGQALKKIIGKYSASYPGAVSPALSSSSALPYAGAYPPHPTPLQPPDHSQPMHPYGSASTDSVPSMSANNSSDSNSFATTPGMYEPQHDPSSHIPHLVHPQPHHHAHHSMSVSQAGSPKHHYRTTPVLQEKVRHGQAHGDYVSISPTHISQYSGTTAYYPGMGDVRSPSDPGLISGPAAPAGVHALYGVPPPGLSPPYIHHQPHADPHHPHVHGQQHHLPHVHQTIERHPSSNDLRVVYNGMAQT